MTMFAARAGMGQLVRGVALVAKDGFSARYDLDRQRGVFSRPEHKLAGRSYVDRVLVLDAAKGGVATAWMLRRLPREEPTAEHRPPSVPLAGGRCVAGRMGHATGTRT